MLAFSVVLKQAWKPESLTPASKLLCLWFYINEVSESGTEMSYMEVHGLPMGHKALRYVPRLPPQSAQRYEHPCTSLDDDQKWSIHWSLPAVLGACTLQGSHSALWDGAGSQLTGGHAQDCARKSATAAPGSPGSWDTGPASEGRCLTGEDGYGSEMLSTGRSDLAE